MNDLSPESSSLMFIFIFHCHYSISITYHPVPIKIAFQLTPLFPDSSLSAAPNHHDNVVRLIFPKRSYLHAENPSVVPSV